MISAHCLAPMLDTGSRRSTQFVVVVIILLITSIASYGQKENNAKKNEQAKYQLRFDTLNAEEIKFMANDGRSILLDTPPGVLFDTAQFELIYKGELIGIVSYKLGHTIPSKRVLHTKFRVEILADDRVLLHIIKILNPN